MIKFFKHIRKALMEEGKFNKYLLYAIGEIILVVIGILIALQINNWNEIRLQRNEESDYLDDLKIEFTRNLSRLVELREQNNSHLENALKIANYVENGDLTLSESEFNICLFNSLLPEVQYRPSPGILNEILNSGKLGIISNTDLRTKLSAWEGVILKVRFQEDEHNLTRLKLLDKIYTDGNFRGGYLVTDYDLFALNPKTSDVYNRDLSQTQEFDNLLSVFYLTGKFLNDSYYQELKTNIEDILELIEYEKKL